MKKTDELEIFIIDEISMIDTVLNYISSAGFAGASNRIAVITHLSMLTGNGKHPLTRMLFDHFDTVIYQSFGVLRVWQKPTSKTSKLPLDVIFPLSKPSVAIGIFRRHSFPKRLKGLLQKLLDGVPCRIHYEVLTPLSEEKFSWISSTNNVNRWVGLSHNSGGFIQSNQKDQHVNKIFSNGSFIRNLFPSSTIELMLFPNLAKRLPDSLPFDMKLVILKKVSASWLDLISESDNHLAIKTPNRHKALVVLLSRPSSSDSADLLNPSPSSKRKMLRDINDVLKHHDFKGVIVRHPVEKRRNFLSVDAMNSLGWSSGAGIHSLNLIKNADLVITFGTQLVEDCLLLGKPVIEYRIDWSGGESIFMGQTKVFFANNKEGLNEIVTKIGNRL